jgi:(R,R)-butanediol dehydrogenase/meso-butanediol dehydrogenase/diacetyl reductase
MPFELITKEVEVIGSMAYAPGVFERVIDLMAAGHYPTDGWVEHIAWDDVVSEGLEPLRRGRRAKVLVDLPD